MALPAALEPDAATRFRSRILIARHRHAWTFLPSDGEGTQQAIAPGDADTLPEPVPYVVVESGDKPRVLAEQGGWRLLLYVDTGDARTVVVAPSRLCPRPDCGDSSNGLTLYPGFPIDVIETSKGASRVVIHDQDIHATGFLPAHALGVVFQPQSAPPRNGWVDLRSGTKLLDAPNGELVAEIEPGAVLAAMPLGAPRSSFAPVLVRRTLALAWDPRALAWEARGFVPAAALGQPCGDTGAGPAGPLPVRYADFPSRLPAGTRVHDKPTGPMIGIASTEAVASLSDTAKEGWRATRVPTPWGSREVWINETR